MPIENQVRAFAGTFILLSLALCYFHSTNWLYFTAFVGANLLQSAFTDFCPLEILLRKLQKQKRGPYEASLSLE
jgi:hypothetical protein